MEYLQLIITICMTHSPTNCYVDKVMLYPKGGTIPGTCMKSAMQVLPGKYNALSNSAYHITRWKCKKATS